MSIIKKLTKLANHLDSKGLTKEADYLDNLLFKISGEMAPHEKLNADNAITIGINYSEGHPGPNIIVNNFWEYWSQMIKESQPNSWLHFQLQVAAIPANEEMNLSSVSLKPEYQGKDFEELAAMLSSDKNPEILDRYQPGLYQVPSIGSYN